MEDFISGLTILYHILKECDDMFDECLQKELGINCDGCRLDRNCNIPLWQDGDEGDTQQGGIESGDIIFPINPCRLIWNLAQIIYGGSQYRAKMLNRVLECEEFGKICPDEDLGCEKCELENPTKLAVKIISDGMNPIAEGTIVLPVNPCELIRALAEKINAKKEVKLNG